MPDDAARVDETEPPSSMLTDSQAKLLGFRRHRARRDPFAAASVMTMRPHQAGLESKVHPRRQSDDRSKMRPVKDRDVQDDAIGALHALRARLANVVGERDLLERQLKQMEQHLCLLEQQPALDDLKKKLVHTEDDRDAMRRHLKSKCDALETKAAELSVLAAELAALQHFKANCACNAFKNALSKSVTQCDRLRAELDEKNSEISGLTHGLAKVKQACECESLRNQLRLVKQDLALCDDLTAVLEATQAELSTLKQKIVASEEEKQALKQQLAIAQEQLDGIAREWAVQREGDMTALQGRMRDELHTLVHQSEQLRSSLNESNDKFEQHRLRLLGSVIARSKRRQLSMSFSQFTMKVREEQQERAEEERRQHIMSKIVRRLMNASISAAFDRWRSNVHEGQQLKAKARKVVQRMINGCLVATFQAWLEHSTSQIEERAEEERRQNLTTKRINQMTNRSSLLAFDSWRNTMNLKRRLVGIAQRILNFCLATAFELWTSNVADRTKLKAKARKVVQRMINGCLVATFQAWLEHSTAQIEERAEEERRQHIMSKIVRRLMNASISAAFDRWRSNVHEGQQLKAKARKVVQRMINGCLVATFQAWLEHSTSQIEERAEEERRQHIMSKIVRRLMNASISAAFDRWRSNVHDGQQLKAKARKVVQRMINGCLVATFQAWLEHSTSQIEERAEEERRQHIMSKIVRRLMNASISAAFDRWRSNVHEGQQLKAKARKVVQRMINGCLVATFQAWLEHSTSQIEERAEEERRQHIMSKIVRRLMNASISAAFDRWRSNVHEGQQLKAKARKVVQRMINGCLVATFQAWLEHSTSQIEERAEEERRQHIMSKIVRRLMNASISAAFDRWRSNVHEGQQLKAKARKVVQRMINGCLVATFQAWLEHSTAQIEERAEEERRQHIMSKIVRRLMNASISAAFDRWRSNVHEGQQLKAKARKVVQRMINGCLVATFQAWLEHSTSQIEERAEEERRQHIMSKIVRRLMNASISAAFDRWRSNVHEGQQLKAKARKVVQRMINGCLVATFQAWLEHTTAQARRRALMQRMAAKMLLRELSAAFDRWSENVSEPRRSEGIEEEGLVHDNVHRTSRAYDPTAKEKHEARLYRIREAAQPDLLEMANNGIFATFASWHQIVQDLTHALSCTEAPLLNASGPEAKKMAQKMLLRSDQIKSVKVMTDDKTANLNEAGDENAPIVIDVGKQHAHSSFVPTDVRAGAVRNDALTEKEDVKVAEGGVLDPDQTEILLQQLFSYYCDDSSGVRILRMSQKNYLHMVEDCSLFDDFISEDVIISTFALVVRTSQGEETGYLEYPDYIEALARLALIKYNDNGTPIQLFTRLINSELLHAAPAAVKEKVFAGAVPYTHRNESHPFPEFDQDLLDKI